MVVHKSIPFISAIRWYKDRRTSIIGHHAAVGSRTPDDLIGIYAGGYADRDLEAITVYSGEKIR
jgi:hypothetical protein